MPKLTEDLVPSSSRLPHCIKCCKICSMKKCRSRYAHHSRNAGGTCAHPKRSHELTAVVRVALGRAITQQWFLAKMKSMLLASIHHWSVYCTGVARRWWTGARAGGSFTGETQEALSRQEMLGAPPVLLVTTRCDHYCLASCAAACRS